MATHSSILAWKIPSTEEPDTLQLTRSQSRTQLSTRHVLRLNWLYLSVVFIRPYAHVQEKGRGCLHPMWPGPGSVPRVQLAMVIFPDAGSGWVGQSSGSVCIWPPGTEFCEDLGQVQKSGTSPASRTSLLMDSHSRIRVCSNSSDTFQLLWLSKTSREMED